MPKYIQLCGGEKKKKKLMLLSKNFLLNQHRHRIHLRYLLALQTKNCPLIISNFKLSYCMIYMEKSECVIRLKQCFLCACSTAAAQNQIKITTPARENVKLKLDEKSFLSLTIKTIKKSNPNI